MSKRLPVAVAAISNCSLINAGCRSRLYDTFHSSNGVLQVGTDGLKMPFNLKNKLPNLKRGCIHCLGWRCRQRSGTCSTDRWEDWARCKFETPWSMTAPTHVRHMKCSLKGGEHMKRNSYKEKGGWQEGTTETGERGKRKNQCMTVIWLLGKNSRVANCCCRWFRVFFFFLLHLAFSSCSASQLSQVTLIWAAILSGYWPMHPSMLKPWWSSHQSDVRGQTEGRNRRRVKEARQ